MTAGGEFELIDAIVSALGAATTGTAVVLGPGDDAAILALPAGAQLVTSVDSLVPDVHFPATADPELIGYRALAVSASDLAAMGAAPLGAVVALVLPGASERSWVTGLARGLASAATAFGLPVTGGNLAAGPLSITVTVQGSVPVDSALRRSGASAGDALYVSGPLGGAALALAEPGLAALRGAELQGDTSAARYYRPQPRLRLGDLLRGVASSAIDISDGLVADLLHVARASEVDIHLDSSALPHFVDAVTGHRATRQQVLAGGDDYELAFTAPATAMSRLVTQLDETATDAPVRIGRCATISPAGPTLWLDERPLADGSTREGYDHFARD